jgi:hypothetical protein
VIYSIKRNPDIGYIIYQDFVRRKNEKTEPVPKSVILEQALAVFRPTGCKTAVFISCWTSFACLLKN